MERDMQGQVSSNAAVVYEEVFVPALFRNWVERVADAARIEPGQRVLDVACGTGVLARAVSDRVGDAGAVVGLDVNEGMLTVATKIAPHIEWRPGRAEALPFEDGSFDRVVSQFGLMFFENRSAAIREMMRVLRPGGRLAVAVWDTLENSPGFSALTGLLRRLFGDEVANHLHAPFVLGDVESLRAIFEDAGVADAEIQTMTGVARFASIDAWVYSEVRGWVFADMLDDAQFEQVRTAAQTELVNFQMPDGSVAFEQPAHIVTADKH